jgi:hypothetical protein
MSCTFTMVFGVVAMITLNTSAPRPVGIIFLLLALVAFGLGVNMVRPRKPPTPVTRPPQWMMDAQEFGAPGRGLEEGTFGVAARIGRRGEEMTAQLIRDRIFPIAPNARLFNTLYWPGSRTADIDQALLIDKDIYLIDSKLYEQGRYTWDDGPGTLMYERPRLAPSASSGRLEQTGYSPGQSKPSFKLGFALQEMRRHSSGLVHGIVVVHGDVEIRTRYEEPVPHADEIPAPTDDGKRDPVYVCTPEGLVRYIEARIDEAARSLEPIEDPRESTSPPRYLMMTNLDPETGRYEEVSLPGTYKVPVRTAQSLRARMKPD